MSESEDNGDSIFGISEDLVPPAVIKQAGTSEIDFDGLLKTPLRLHEDLKGGCGGQLWPAGMVLSKYLLRKDKQDFAGKQIIELGAGGGLVGLALALHTQSQSQPQQPAHVHITDQLPMYSLMQRNITLNNLPTSLISPTIYDWGETPPQNIPNPPDIILAADCVYFEPAFPLLQSTLKDLMGKDTVCWFCFKKRRRADLGFMKTVRKNFVVEDVMDDADREVWSREGLFLYRITKKP